MGGRRLQGALALLALLTGLVGCAGGRAAAPPPDPAGPYAVGIRRIAFDGTVAEVWYPASPAAEARARAAGAHPAAYDIRDWLPASVAATVARGRFRFGTDAFVDLPVAGPPIGRAAEANGGFPLVLFAHGLYSFPDQSSELTTWLASWGYVVAAPDLPIHDLAAYFDYTAKGIPLPAGPSDVQILAATVRTMTTEDTLAGGPFQGRIGTSRIAVMGHSQGGIDAMAFASAPGVATYIALAAGFAAPHPPLPPVPSLYIAGRDDHDIPLDLVEQVYATAAAPKRLLVLPGAGHLAFTDLCLIGAGYGGLSALGAEISARLPPGAPFTARALDGCGPSYAPPAASTARVRAAVLAQLRRWLPAPAPAPAPG